MGVRGPDVDRPDRTRCQRCARVSRPLSLGPGTRYSIACYAERAVQRDAISTGRPAPRLRALAPSVPPSCRRAPAP
jgi:hypothetical protein